MKLVSVALHGYKRFDQQSSMNVDGKLIAVVGPNESGKTSFLEALMHLNHHNLFDLSGASRETTRNRVIPADQAVVSATYLLGDDDREALREVHGGQEVRWCTISKRAEASRHYYTFKPSPRRSMQPRQRAVRVLNDVSSRQGFQKLGEEYEESDLAAEVQSLASTLSTEVQTMSDEALEEIRSVTATLEGALSESEKDFKYLSDLRQDLHDLVEHETGNPVRQTINILSPRQPTFLRFSDEERLLQSEYVLDEVWESPPAALGNLAQLADLDLEALHNAIAANDSAEVESMLERANEQLKQH